MKIYTVVHILPTLIFKMKQLKKEPKKVLKRMIINWTRSVLFLTISCIVPPIARCYWSKWGPKTDRMRAGLPGVFSVMIGCLFETQGRQREIGLFLLPKSIAGIYSMLYVRGLVPALPNIEVLILILALGFIGLASSQTGRKDGIKPIFDNLLSKLWD